MSQESLVSVGEVLREAATSAAWRQWGAIFTIAPSDRPAQAIVDPEALLLVSMVLAGHEPRLWRVCRLWAKSGVRLLSVQRTKNLLRIFDGGVDTQLAEFATIAVSPHGRYIAGMPAHLYSFLHHSDDFGPIMENK